MATFQVLCRSRRAKKSINMLRLPSLASRLPWTSVCPQHVTIDSTTSAPSRPSSYSASEILPLLRLPLTEPLAFPRIPSPALELNTNSIFPRFTDNSMHTPIYVPPIHLDVTAVSNAAPEPAAQSLTAIGSTNQRTWNLPVHPQTCFHNPEAARAAINGVAAKHGYAVVQKTIVYVKKKNRRRIVLACDRHSSRRQHRSSAGACRPNSASRRCGCKMQMHLVRVLAENGEIKRWQIEHRGTAYTHNHPPSAGIAAHPSLRRESRTPAVRQVIATDWQTGIRASQTLARLALERAEVVITPRDLYNERQRAERAELCGKTRIEYLLECLREGPYFVRFQTDKFNRVSRLFFAYNDAIVIYRENFDIVLMDCTYRTNRFGMPLLNVVGVTGMNTTIHIAQVFMVDRNFPSVIAIFKGHFENLNVTNMV